MVIGINGYEAVVPRFGFDEKTGLPRRVGSGEYCYQLLVNLNKIDKKNDYIIYLPEKQTTDLPKESANWHYKIIKPRKMWTLFGLSLEFFLRRSKPDVFLSPTHYLPFFSPKKSFISILDVSYLKFPELFKKSDLNQLTKWTRYSAKKAKGIFTISQASKGDIINEYGVPKKRVVVTYPGIKEVLSSKYKVLSMSELEKKYGIKGQYILFVGTLQPRKNIIRLIQAFAENSKLTCPRRGKTQNSKLQLVIIGKRGWQYEEILEAPEKYGIKDKVVFLENITNEELQTFYKNATCFVLPSLYEGFGLPILEAMQYGCPVITSNVSSLPEVGGDAALYVDPLDANDIKEKLELMINDEGLRIKLAKKGYEQAKKFSWEKTARETLSVLEGLNANDK